MIPQWLKNLLAAEPAVVINAVAGALALAATFGISLGDPQIDAIKTFVLDTLIFVGAVLGTRQSVFAPDTHAAEVQEAASAAAEAVAERG